MILYIDTSSRDRVKLRIERKNKIIARKSFKAPKRQAEKLLPELDNLLKAKNIKLGEIKEVVVANEGESFTSLRIGVLIANALAYALGVPVRAISDQMKKTGRNKSNIVTPIYSSEPVVGTKKKLI